MAKKHAYIHSAAVYSAAGKELLCVRQLFFVYDYYEM